jgi:hypothetical protein
LRECGAREHLRVERISLDPRLRECQRANGALRQRRVNGHSSNGAHRRPRPSIADVGYQAPLQVRVTVRECRLYRFAHLGGRR